MLFFALVKVRCTAQSGGINTFKPENAMDTTAFDELAGRIEGVAQAMLRLAAELEVAGLIDGPRMAADWRATQPPQHMPDTAVRRSARTTLAQLADSLTQAARYRAQAQGC